MHLLLPELLAAVFCRIFVVKHAPCFIIFTNVDIMINLIESSFSNFILLA